jgi:hypothetical protein
MVPKYRTTTLIQEQKGKQWTPRALYIALQLQI